MWGGAASGGSAPAYTSLPTGWLLCDGSNVSRTTYASLFTAISTRYGTGDGSTTFGLPNFLTRLPLGLAAASTPTVPSTLSSGNQSADHSHSISSNAGNVSSDHSHGFSANTGFVSNDHTHGFSVYYNGGNVVGKTTGGINQNHFHGVSGNTGGISANHNHGITSNAGNQSADHSHNVNTVQIYFIIRAS
jgi:microcystin-dependent protein